MRRDHDRIAPGQDPHLHTRAADLAGDHLLDDPSVGELLQIGGRQRAQPDVDRGLLLACARGRQVAQGDDQVALAIDRVVELDDGGLHARSCLSQRDHRAGELGGAAQPVGSRRVRDTGARKQGTAAALEPVASEAVIDAVDRDVELEREVALVLAHVERHDERPAAIRHQLPQPSQQLRPLEDLLRERPRGVVLGAEQMDASARILRRRIRPR